MKEKEEKILEEDIEGFLKEKERIRKIIGRIGGRVTFVSKVVNLFWAVAMVGTFVVSIFMQNTLRLIMIELGILLVSFKVIYYFHRQAKINHFQFWILSSLEWRMSEIMNRLNDMAKNRKV